MLERGWTPHLHVCSQEALFLLEIHILPCFGGHVSLPSPRPPVLKSVMMWCHRTQPLQFLNQALRGGAQVMGEEVGPGRVGGAGWTRVTQPVTSHTCWGLSSLHPLPLGAPFARLSRRGVGAPVPAGHGGPPLGTGP